MRLVAQVADDLPALRVCALLEEPVVVADRGFVHRRDVDAALDALVVRLECLRGEILDAGFFAPAREDVVGRAPRHAAVDHRRAADGATLLEHDRRVADRHRRAAVAVELANHLRRVRGEVARLVVAAFFEHDHVEAGLGELGRHRRAAGTRADDHRVAIEHEIMRDVGAREHIARPNVRFVERHHHATSCFAIGRSGSGARICFSCARTSSANTVNRFLVASAIHGPTR